MDFGDGPEVADAAAGLQQAVDEKRLADEALAAAVEAPSAKSIAPPKKKKKRDASLVYVPPQLEIRVAKFPKYACPNQPECRVTQAAREAGDNHPQVASVLLAMFHELYDIEARAQGLDPLLRLGLRQRESAAV